MATIKGRVGEGYALLPTRVLYINLSEKRYDIVERPDLFEKYLGGSGVATVLLEEECPKGTDPLGPDNPIIFAIGPLTGILPVATKVVATFKSPYTGGFGESHAGGRLGWVMRAAGFGAIVVKGQAERPTYLAIHDDKVAFRDASALWGVRSVITVGQVIAQIEPGRGRRSIMRIGLAGENLVRYACVNVDSYRHFGRLGLGAVFGSKKLKAIIVSASRGVPVPKTPEFRRLYDEIFRTVVESGLMRKYHDLGTAANIMALQHKGMLPAKNWSTTQFEFAHELSGETLAERLLFRKMSCVGCPVGCIHVAMLRIRFSPAHDYGSIPVSYDYEPLYALGTNLGMQRAEDVLQVIERCEAYGLDAITAGGVLAWATEAFQRGLISERDTFGVRFAWGAVNEYCRAIDYIATPPNDFYKVLGQGTLAAAERYGGLDFAVQVAGVEPAGYATGPATLVGHLVGPRHSHLDNAGYSIDQKIAPEEANPDTIAEALWREQQGRIVLTSLVVCLFARNIYKPEIVERALRVLGIERSWEELLRTAADVYRRKIEFNRREGVDPFAWRIPSRLLEIRTPHGYIRRDALDAIRGAFLAKAGIAG